MAGKNHPSIYDERTSIGSADELDEYGVWVKTEPQDLSNSVPDIEELPDFDDVSTDDLEMPDFDDSLSGDIGNIEEAPVDTKDIEFEEIPEYSELPEGLAPTSIDGDGFTEVSMDDFLDSSAEQKSLESIDFGDLDSSVPEIESVEPAENKAPLSGSTAAGKDLSTQLLQRIADELSSIKKEISSLKNELSVVRGEIKSTETAASQGFFDEEDDEKIALTGDEMDNILNTANFTEETGFGETEVSYDSVPESADGIAAFEEKNEDMVEINFDEELSELDGAIHVEDVVKGSAPDDFDISLDLDADEGHSELDTLREEGALPITEAPEDTSYLEDDPLASLNSTVDEIDAEMGIPDDSFAEESITEAIDLSGAVIDEPDISSGITDNPVSEPMFENISIDLDMEDAPADDKPLGADDFIFETEDTVEIPVSGLPDIDENILPIDSGESDLLPETPSDINFEDTVPQGLYDSAADGIPNNLKHELKIVLSYMDQLLESLPEDKIEEFAQSEYFDTYKKLFEELGLV
jgi:hypothetical protein